MDFDNIIVILLWLITAKWTVGAGYGIYLLRNNPGPWDWKDTWMVGPLFWAGYGLGRGVKWCMTRIRSARS